MALPKLGNHKIGALAQALETMRNKLGGKEYAEQLLHQQLFRGQSNHFFDTGADG